MSVRRTIVTAGLLAIMLCGALLISPDVATAARSDSASCISTVAGDTCLAHCIGNLQRDCEPSPACHQEVAAAIQALASTPAGSPMCAELVAAAKDTCGCP
jgi:hypothetical protein